MNHQCTRAAAGAKNTVVLPAALMRYLDEVQAVADALPLGFTMIIVPDARRQDFTPLMAARMTTKQSR